MKYTVLVVEDEQNQRRAIVERVDWSSAGFEVIGEAENGAEALDLVETLEPDLIMTDIQMPMITGLELAARVREIRPATQIVILSGYDSFEYARTAINYNIISYLLKPISSSELTEELFKIHRRMDERIAGVVGGEKADAENELHRLTKTGFLMPLMLGGGEEQLDDNELAEKAIELGIIDSSSQRYGVIVSKFKNASGENCIRSESEHTEFIGNVIGRYMKCETFVSYGRAVTFVVVPDGETLSTSLELPLRELVQSAKRVLNEKCTVGVSREFTGLSHCSSAYFQAITARRYTSDGAGEIRFIADQERDGEFELEYVEKTVMKLEQLLKVGDAGKLTDFINELYEKNTPENANLLVVQIIASVCRVVSNSSDKTELARLVESNPIFARITSYSSESGMRNELVRFCCDAKNIIAQSQRRESEILCDKAMQIIDARYADENLSLTGISAELAVSPNYLSTLIKKEKKKNFITLLTERRMKAAYDMLVCSTMKVLEIAEKCGYSDQHYFSYCFKKFYGESPNKVRGTNKVDS